MKLEYLQHKLSGEAETERFSGAVLVKKQSQTLAASYGSANISEERLNHPDTRFGIASGCKLFTAIAVCQLVEQGKLAFSSKVLDVLNGKEFARFSHDMTVHHLLTHSSGIADYFDEEIMDDYAALWLNQPMYLLRKLQDFVPMFSQHPMKFTPGERFHYNNAGYIMLGLLVEKISGMPFTDYVEQHIFSPCGMKHSGYFALDALPANTAMGYIEEADGNWVTNIYSIPVKGGADGGAFVTAPDMQRLWQGLLDHTLLNPELTALLLTPHIHDDNEEYYGYGVWITKRNGEALKYHLMGYDPGVSFHSAFYPASGATVVVLCNKSRGAYPILKVVEEWLLQ